MALVRYCIGSLLALLLACSMTVSAEESLCAEVKIEISQELTLERQAFEATMRITNTLDTFALEDIEIDILFKDDSNLPVIASSNANSTTAKFFIKLDAYQGIDSLSEGADGKVTEGKINPAQIGELRWLIIPTQGAGGDGVNGRLYFVGATLSFAYGGKTRIVDVADDSIVVKPQPKLILDYFLTKEVNGDNPFTTEIEPVEPYSLGVRISNRGSGAANQVKIDSAQPKIVENKQNLLVDFTIVGSFVDNDPVSKTLLLNFGKIAGNTNRTGRWIMETSLTGRFVELNAKMSHADELGGALTSLVDGVNTHFLVHDVLVDLPGRDGIADFLAHNGSQSYKVYESDNLLTSEQGCEDCTVVVNLSGSLGPETHSGDKTHRKLTTTATNGLGYLKFADPYRGEKPVAGAIRSDGKKIPARNVWLSKSLQDDKIHFDYYINLFDGQPKASYTLTFGGASVARAPVLQAIADRSIAEDTQVGFLVRASDPNGTVPTLTLLNPPVGSAFTEKNNGTATFHWIPAVGQAGNYILTFDATDGVLKSSRHMKLTVFPKNDSDGDGMEDAWEIENFNDLSRDGTGDFDGDGLTDFEEYQNGSNPLVADSGPGAPEILLPVYDSEVATRLPLLVVRNSQHESDLLVNYTFELYEDAAYATKLAQVSNVPEGSDTTSLQLSAEDLFSGEALSDNTPYYWRVQAVGQHVASDWVNGLFHINLANEAPEVFEIASPLVGATINSVQPVLTVNNSVDPDGDELTYSFYVYLEQDENFENPTAQVVGVPAGEEGQTHWQVSQELQLNQTYFWIASANDGHGAVTDSDAGSFIIGSQNERPASPAILTPVSGSGVNAENVELTVSNAADPEGQELEYIFEIDQVATFDSSMKRSSGSVSEGLATTSWLIAGLADGIHYYWRVKASDGQAVSDWVTASFTVSLNQPLATPVPNNPADNTWVDVIRPTLSVHPITGQQDDIHYVFEVYTDENGVGLLSESGPVTAGQAMVEWLTGADLDNETSYWWRAKAVNQSGNTSAWSELRTFTVKLDNVNDIPVMNFVEPVQDLTVFGGTVVIQWTDSDPDSSASIQLLANGEEIAGGIAEDEDGESDRFEWHMDLLADGIYSISAVITDEESTVTVPWYTVTKLTPMVCDLNGDSYIDRTDVLEIIGRRNAPAMHDNDPADPNSDGVVNIIDVRLCVLQCALPLCATQ